MKRVNRWVHLGLIVAALPLSGCGGSSKKASRNDKSHPAEVEKINGSDISRVTLTDSAMKRLDIQTDVVSEAQSPRKKSPQKAVPYSAVLYDTRGKTWVYTSPQPQVFVRKEISVDFIKGGTAYLLDGPDVGTKVAKVGVAELYGTESKFGH